jgi:uncharacterized protein YbjT (DUF2867 family)
MFVVTGATGNTGSVVAHALLDAGHAVRAFVRNADKAAALRARGAELVLGDLTDVSVLAEALKGASGLYLLSPPDMSAQNFVAERAALFRSIAQAARKAALSHVVLLSSIGAQQESGTGPILSVRAGELALTESGVPSTFVRSAYFVANWGAVLPLAQKDGVLPSFLPANWVMPMVDTDDIGRVAARALLDGPKGVRKIELSGPVDVSPADVAAAAGKILGRSVTVTEAPLDAVVPTFTSFGISAHVAGLYREMYEGILDGKVAAEPGNEQVRGAISLEKSLRKLLGR